MCTQPQACPDKPQWIARTQPGVRPASSGLGNNQAPALARVEGTVRRLHAFTDERPGCVPLGSLEAAKLQICATGTVPVCCVNHVGHQGMLIALDFCRAPTPA